MFLREVTNDDEFIIFRVFAAKKFNVGWRRNVLVTSGNIMETICVDDKYAMGTEYVGDKLEIRMKCVGDKFEMRSKCVGDKFEMERIGIL